MMKLSIQDWIKNINDYYISFSHLTKFSNDIKTYNKQIQEMQKPSGFENQNDYILYCKDIQVRLQKQKLDNHINLTRKLKTMLDESYLLSKTTSEQVLSEYIKYLEKWVFIIILIKL